MFMFFIVIMQTLFFFRIFMCYVLIITLKQMYNDLLFFFSLPQTEQNETTKSYHLPLPTATLRKPVSQGHCIN